MLYTAKRHIAVCGLRLVERGNKHTPSSKSRKVSSFTRRPLKPVRVIKKHKESTRKILGLECVRDNNGFGVSR